MSNSIEIRSISKRYMLGAREEAGQLRERLVGILRGGLSRRREKESIWALREISFAVPQGQVVGIVGRNGAGKSTLLKILSSITHPTSGSIFVQGRVASLLEIGTGFHEELTGRENIYLNGSILGMKRREINQRFDAIVDFAGLAQFLETPIKRYSSGMRLRLGFAVAAHLDPDVLIVDEVLAVGDASFQKKCIAAMEDLRGGGRTVLFVSHNMAAVENLCSRGLWIDQGRLRMDGLSRDVIRAYLGSYAAEEAKNLELEVRGRTGSGEGRFTRVELFSADGTASSVIQSGDALTIRMHYRADCVIQHAYFDVYVYTEMGTLVTVLSTWLQGISIPSISLGDGCIDVKLDAVNLIPARYTLTFKLWGKPEGRMLDGDVRMHLDVEPSGIHQSARPLDSRFGIVYFGQRWILPNSEDR